jgi:phosphoenolpyruvate-protein phosphotransferase
VTARLRGLGASAGVAVGPAFVVREVASPIGGRVEPGGENVELERFNRAARETAADLERLAQRVAADGHTDEAGIFDAQAAMAADSTLEAGVAARVREQGDDAVAATHAAARELADGLRALDDETLAARASDLIDVADRIARRLEGERSGGVSSTPQPTEPSIVVAHDLAPSVAASIPRERLLGIALEGGSTTAHAAILARAYGIPAVVGASALLAAVDDAAGQTEIAIDGETGEVFVAPDPAALRSILVRGRLQEQRSGRDVADAELPAVTLDGLAVALLANIGSPSEAARARALGATGVGLFRTEFLFLERSEPPSEAEQLEADRAVVDAFAPGPVTIRLLDAGGDKAIPYLGLPPEANPFLGARGLRLAVHRPELFERQLRAACRAAIAGPVKVMAPMVADLDDVAILRGLAQRASAALAAEALDHRPVALGAMVEIPSAVVVADRLFRELDFVSLGTNDLLQYLLAADRGNPALGRYHDPLHPALLRVVHDAVTAARHARIELSVCGEMAGDPLGALALVGLGVRTLSMAAASLPAVRRAIRARAASDLERSATAAADARDASEARRILEPLLQPV